jgi:hypothetical protein
MQKNNMPSNLDSIYGLISELSSHKPDAKVLKTLCADAGLTYESDLVQLMSKVLVVASSVSKNGSKIKKTSKLLTSEA